MSVKRTKSLGILNFQQKTEREKDRMRETVVVFVRIERSDRVSI